jgi:predicted SnoaL-like aldol condensation-catalyzing enzyme
MDQEANKTLVRRYIEMINTGSVALVDEVLVPGWVDHAHPELTDLESVKRAVLEFKAATPDFHIIIENILSEGDMVALRGAVHRTKQGQEVISRLAWFIRIEDGKMAEAWTYHERPN